MVGRNKGAWSRSFSIFGLASGQDCRHGACRAGTVRDLGRPRRLPGHPANVSTDHYKPCHTMNEAAVCTHTTKQVCPYSFFIFAPHRANMAFMKCHRTPFRDCLHCRVGEWLGRTSNIPDEPSCCSKTHDFEMPPSPPASSARASSPSKRRRPDDEARQPVLDFDITPRPSRQLVFEVGLSSIHRSSSRSTPSKRSVSPIKFIKELEMLVKPIRIEKPRTATLPPDMRSLYTSVQQIVEYSSAFVPVEAQKAINEYTLAVDMVPFPPSLFKVQEGDQDAHAVAEEERELESLLEIVAGANKCDEEGLSKFSWNIEVHAALLKLATRKTPGVSQYEIISARISQQWLPPIRTDATWAFPRSWVTPSPVSSRSTSSTTASSNNNDPVAAGRMVDFGFFMETKSTQLEQVISALTLQSAHHSVNHSNYSPLRSLPLGVSIETKSPGATEKGLIQLAIWTAAWFQRMEHWLQSSTYRQTKFAMLQAVPAVLVNGHSWRLLFFCNRGDYFACVGEIPMGETTTLTGTYKVLAVLRLLVRWVDKDLREWFEGLFLRA